MLEGFDEEGVAAAAYLVSGLLGLTASSAATTRYFSHSMSGSSAIFCFPGRSRCSPAYVNQFQIVYISVHYKITY